MRLNAYLAALAVGILLPLPALAAPFGGPATSVIPCFNGVIHTFVGAPRGGSLLWAPGVTRTFRFGPPSRPGQYLLGLTGAPYFCLVSVVPIIVIPGILMNMLGSSQ
jgi:hypothetical protein